LNVYRSHLRRYRPFMASDDDALRELTVPPAQESLPVEQVHEAVRRAVRHLPPKYRDPLILYYFEEEDVGATARILQLPAGTIKARLHRGRELLRERLRRWTTS
jgi:RNA polymerase sigma-70 factor (ECF subfamily)